MRLLETKRVIPAIAAMAAVWIAGITLTAPRAASQQKAPTSDQVFKNIQVLKGTTVDDFLGTMGVMSAALGFDCSECHANAGTDKVDWAADTHNKVVARKMVTMMQTINKDNFSGRQMVTCWSCHHGRDRPATTPQLETVYGPGSTEMDDTLTQMPGQPEAATIIDQYLQAIGGAQKLADIKSYIETGTSIGFGGFGGGGEVHIYAKAPDARATHIVFKAETGRGEVWRTYNGKLGWIKSPLTVLPEYELNGGELDGARLDAQMGFPGQMKQVLTNLRVSLPVTISDLPGPSSQTSNEHGAVGIGKDQLVNVVQGSGPNGMLATLYFDQKSNLLLRMVRYARSPIGRVPTQVDYSDYREVPGGVKMPFHMTFAWLDGRDAIHIDKVETNVPIDAAIFGKPPSSK
jgi:photosynthetic reaction center cytochrome c subunit